MYYPIPLSLNPFLISNQIESGFNCTYKTLTNLLPDVVNISFNNKMIYGLKNHYKCISTGE